MNVRRPYIPALLAALALACSKPAANPRQTAADQLQPELALTVPAAPSVVSELEASRPGNSKQLSSPRKRVAARKQHVSAVPKALAALPSVETRVQQTITTGGLEPAATTVSTGTETVSEPAAPGPSAAAPQEPASDGGWQGPEPGGRRPGIIIRGGITGRDPCDLHHPHGGRGVPTILVNPRYPGGGIPGMPRGGGVINF